jgi:transposase
MTEGYDGRQVVGMDLHRRRSVLVRMTEDGRRLETVRVTNSPAALRAVIARAGEHPRVVIEAVYGWYWAVDVLEAAGAEVHLAHPLGVKAYSCRRVKNDLLTELPNVSAVQIGCTHGRRPSGMSERSESPGRRGPLVSPIAAETGHTTLNRSPAFSSLPVFGVNCSTS